MLRNFTYNELHTAAAENYLEENVCFKSISRIKKHTLFPSIKCRNQLKYGSLSKRETKKKIFQLKCILCNTFYLLKRKLIIYTPCID